MGVRSHEFTTVYIAIVIYAGLPVDVSVSLCKQRPRFAQGQPRGYFQMKELDRTTEAIVPKNEMWPKASPRAIFK